MSGSRDVILPVKDVILRALQFMPPRRKIFVVERFNLLVYGLRTLLADLKVSFYESYIGFNTFLIKRCHCADLKT